MCAANPRTKRKLVKRIREHITENRAIKLGRKGSSTAGKFQKYNKVEELRKEVT